MSYSINKLAKIAGVTVRTLHYYDEIGLLKPSYVAGNGYRFYEEKELLKLQQILFFRELEFPLEKIKLIMQSPDFRPLPVFEDQRDLLHHKQKRIAKMLKTINKTITSLKGGENMSNNDKYSAFNDPTYQKHKDEVEKKWGNTEAYRQSMERVGKMSKTDLERIKAEGEDIADTAGELMKKSFSSDSPEVQEQMNRFFNHLKNFYEPNPEMFNGLGQMYVDDPRFTEYYEKKAKGLAVFMRDAMAFYAKTHQEKAAK